MHDESPMAIIARHQTTWPIKVGPIARDLGIRVVRESLGPAIAGQLIRDKLRGGSSGFIVYINSDDSINKQKFTLAHEIAHFVLHRDLIDNGIIDDTMYRSDLGGYYEVQANQLAADIIMPIRLVKRAIQEESDAKQLAKLFEVSEQAMKIRLKGMGISA